MNIQLPSGQPMSVIFIDTEGMCFDFMPTLESQLCMIKIILAVTLLPL